jgi:rod shape-determining protein MreD
MTSGLFQRLDGWGRTFSPFAICLLLILVSIAPLRVPILTTASPLLPLMAVYHFGLFRPTLLPHWLVLLFGLLIDLLAGSPVGVNAVVLLMVRHFVEANQRFLVDKPFAVIWFGYALASAGAVAGIWALTCFLIWMPIDPRPAIFQYLIALALYPLAGWLFGRSQARTRAA